MRICPTTLIRPVWLTGLLCIGLCSAGAAQQQHKTDLASADANRALPAKAAPPSVAQVPPAGYLLGPSDVIRVSVWKEPELSQTAVIRPDGKISIPLIGEIQIAGSSIVDGQVLIADKLRSLLANPQVTIAVLEIRSRQAYITGEVGHPGAYPLIASMNVLQLIASAGGLTEYAHRKEIYILRANAARPVRFNYSDVVRGKTRDQNLELAPGDTVVVP